jgi:hypothetical protein
MVSINSLYSQAVDLALNPQHTKWLCPALFALDAVLCSLIIWKVPCTYLHYYLPLSFNAKVLNGLLDTEIDWEAYMQQIEQYVSGERDYTKISGGTGPLVYPAAHVYIYNALYRITDQGRDILLAQMIFGIVYLVTLGIVMMCYRQAKVCVTVFPRSAFRYERLLTWCFTRHLHTYSLCSYCRRGCTVYSCSAASTIASRCCSFGLQYTRTNGVSSQLEAWHIAGALGSRCPFFWLSQLLVLFYFLCEASRLGLVRHG